MKLTRLVTVLLVVVLALAIVPPAQLVEAQSLPPGLVGLPDADALSGRFINITRGMWSLGDTAEGDQIINIGLEVRPELGQFALAIFDGDMGGLWDRWELPPPVGGAGDPFDDVEFVLYRDPHGVGNTNPADQIWSKSGLFMPDDGWEVYLINQDAGAFSSKRGVFLYHLVCRWVITSNWADEQNNFKVAVQGRPFLRSGGTVGLEGFTWKFSNKAVFGSDTMLTTYDGTFAFYFTIPETLDDASLTYTDFWDGDFDLINDTADANSPAFPPFPTSPLTVPEGANTMNDSPDDYPYHPMLRIPPNVYYQVTAPNSAWTVTNGNPSGNSEWELFRIATQTTLNPDVVVPSLPRGTYKWGIAGLDPMNTVFLHLMYDMYPDNPPPPPPPPGTGTPGYWKNAPQAWPVESITIGGVTYTKAQAIAIMNANKALDKTYTMFNALVSAKLNLILGNNASCIATTVLAADQWMAKYGPVGKGVKANSAAWKEGEPLYLKLDAYNNGLLCAPHRD